MESTNLSPLILHIEDDDGDAHLVVRCLSLWPMGVRILRATNGRQGLEILTEIAQGVHERPHLVLLDLKLPYYNGIELLQWTREQETLLDLPVVILTSSDTPSDVEQCQAAGCTEYVTKPMDYVALKREMDNLRVRHFEVAAGTAYVS